MTVTRNDGKYFTNKYGTNDSGVMKWIIFRISYFRLKKMSEHL
jgi:hypothetical protein